MLDIVFIVFKRTKYQNSNEYFFILYFMDFIFCILQTLVFNFRYWTTVFEITALFLIFYDEFVVCEFIGFRRKTLSFLAVALEHLSKVMIKNDS